MFFLVILSVAVCVIAMIATFKWKLNLFIFRLIEKVFRDMIRTGDAAETAQTKEAKDM